MQFSPHYFFRRLFLLACLLSVSFVHAQDSASNFDTAANALVGAKLKAVASIINDLEALDDERVKPLFEALLNGQLYSVKESKALVYAVPLPEDKKQFQLNDVLTGENLGVVTKKAIRKIKSNNKIQFVQK